jgi:hypothetical protein
MMNTCFYAFWIITAAYVHLDKKKEKGGADSKIAPY